jgi:hypothetical protein
VPHRARLGLTFRHKNEEEDLMAIRYASIAVGKCFTTPTNEVRRIVKIDGMRVTYVTRGKMAFPSWDKHSWLFANKEAFATEVSGEVACDCGQWIPSHADKGAAQERPGLSVRG